MGLGARSSSTHVQQLTGGTSVPFNDIPYGGGHITPLSPSLGNDFQQPIGSSANYNFFGVGMLGTSSYIMLVGSISFSLFDMFGNNTFSSTTISARGNPRFGKKKPVQGTIPTLGVNTRSFSSQGLWNP
jgi:hypothetical protein